MWAQSTGRIVIAQPAGPHNSAHARRGGPLLLVAGTTKAAGGGRRPTMWAVLEARWFNPSGGRPG
jgi:hypothetical protein